VSDTHFTRSGGSPPSSQQNSLIPARIAVPALCISSQTGDRVSQQIRPFNFQLVPNGERIPLPAAWCICTTANRQKTAGRDEVQGERK
jgi:hypothetical protein